jgi:signal transduction histidine kinase
MDSNSSPLLGSAQDAERRRIERDLHDGIQQEIVALIAGLRLARNRLSRDQLTAAELTDLQDQAREMLQDLRELARGIHPPVLSDNGLVAALESRVMRFPISVQILADDDELRAERFSEDVEGTAYFVACESLTNVAKHAGTDGARVRLSHSGDRLRLVVEDDGQGFESNGARSGGLANIRDRVGALHGRLTIESRPGAGTSVRAELPLAVSAVSQ